MAKDPRVAGASSDDVHRTAFELARDRFDAVKQSRKIHDLLRSAIEAKDAAQQ